MDIFVRRAERARGTNLIIFILQAANVTLFTYFISKGLSNKGAIYRLVFYVLPSGDKIKLC